MSFLLRNPKKIPEEWRDYEIYFWGDLFLTKDQGFWWYSKEKRIVVPYIRFIDGYLETTEEGYVVRRDLDKPKWLVALHVVEHLLPMHCDKSDFEEDWTEETRSAVFIP